MKKLINLIALVMLVSTNVLTPFSYAQVEIPEVIPENEVGNVEEIWEIPEKDNEITGEIPNSLWEVEWEWSLPLVREMVNETSPAKQGENLEGLKEEVEDSLDAVESPAPDENKIEDTEKVEIDEVVSPVERNTEREKQEKDLEDNNEITEQENVEAEIQGLQKTQEINTMDTTTNSKNIVLQATATVANQTLKINKYFDNDYTVDWWDGTPVETLSSDKTHTYSVASGYTITLSTTADRWKFYKNYLYKPLVPTDGTTVTWVKIVSMPSLAYWFGDSATTPGDNFFYYFNCRWGLTSLPEWSFDMSNIMIAGIGFFDHFNANWQLTSLPEWSFDTSNIMIAETGFFNGFNSAWLLTSLPEWSFNTSKITTVEGSFFSAFNYQWKLTILPEWSFDTSNITTVGNYFFGLFNQRWQLTRLPEWSFRFATWLTIAGDDFFSSFNSFWKLTSLPEWSFNTSNITTVGNYFFSYFNRNWKLTILPEWSFDTSNIITVGNNFFYYFNYNWALISLPDWSFNMSNITIARDNFFYYFNYTWKLTSLPDSFTISSVWASVTSGYSNAFNSPNYTINRKVSDLVSGVTAPSSDRNTFSDNQPWRCGVHENWLVNKANACRIIYDANGWIWTTTWWYDSDTTWVVVWSGIKAPTRTRYTLSGWIDASWNKVEEVAFPDMDGQTLYANWEEISCSDWYVLDSTQTSCVLKEYTITYNLWGWYLEDGEWNKYEWNQVVTYTYDLTGNKYVADFVWTSVKRENSIFLGRYTSWWEFFDSWTILPENNTVYARYECNFWYIENESRTACEKIRVDFDANGWTFSDNDNIYTVIKSKQVLWKIMRTLHTANLDDNDNYTNEFNWQQMNGYTTSIAPYTSWWITTYPISSPSIVYFEEENVEKLDVSIKYWWSPYCTLPWYIIVWTWDHRQFDANYNPGNTGLAVLYIADFPNFWENREKSVEIEGDSFTIYQNSWCPSYWFFANISRTQIVDLIYEDNAFENIPEPTREWHSFKWWYLSDGSEFDTWNVSTWEVTYVYAKWECADGYENKWWECIKKSSWSSGWWGGWWGGGWSSKKTDEDTHSSAEDSQKNTQDDKNIENVIQSDPEHSEWGSEESSNTPVDSSADKSASEWQEILSPSDSSFTKEQKDAYTFAKENWITTKDTIQSAQMNGKLTRIAMAKMLSQYAINVLWQTPDTSKTVKFKDVTNKKDADYDNWVTLAYQLWIMWQNMPNNRFRPNDEVSRAEFATALSRLLYQTTDWKYKSTKEYYIPHMAKLYNEWIISNTDPSMAERRWYVMIMLMRSAK